MRANPAPRAVCLNTTKCATCAEGYALDGTASAGVGGASCTLRAPTPAVALPADLTTPVALTLAVPTTAGTDRPSDPLERRTLQCESELCENQEISRFRFSRGVKPGAFKLYGSTAYM
jgi:hypothetical protein